MPRSAHIDKSQLREAMLQHLGSDADLYPELIEQQFPHVLQRIVALWGKAELDKYFQSLLLPPHPGSKGFPEAVLVEVLGLKAVCHARGLLTTAAEASDSAGSKQTHHDSAHHEEAAAVFERFQRR